MNNIDESLQLLEETLQRLNKNDDVEGMQTQTTPKKWERERDMEFRSQKMLFDMVKEVAKLKKKERLKVFFFFLGGGGGGF